MTDTKTKTKTGQRVWARTGFDLEGIAGAVAALFVGVLLGWLWGPLFLIGFGLAVLILMATRRQARVAPDLANIVTAPCDGVVHSARLALPPTELRMSGGERVRLRIASAPTSTNPVYASINGEVASVILEEPDMSVLLASQPDMAGLAVAHIRLESLGQQVGCTLSTGGFGPRLEILSEAGDPVRLGRVIGKRRLGGWCDVYLPAGTKLMVQEGQTLIGSETVLCRLLGGDSVEAYPEMADSETEFTDSDILTKVSATETATAAGTVISAAADEVESVTPQSEDISLEALGEDVAKQSDQLSEEAVFISGEGEMADPEEAASELFKKLKDEAERGGKD